MRQWWCNNDNDNDDDCDLAQTKWIQNMFTQVSSNVEIVYWKCECPLQISDTMKLSSYNSYLRAMEHSHEIDKSDLENITVGFALEIHSLFLQLNGKQKHWLCLG